MTTMETAVRIAKRLGYESDAKAPGVYGGRCDTCGESLDGNPTIATTTIFSSVPRVQCIGCAKDMASQSVRIHRTERAAGL